MFDKDIMLYSSLGKLVYGGNMEDFDYLDRHLIRTKYQNKQS